MSTRDLGWRTRSRGGERLRVLALSAWAAGAALVGCGGSSPADAPPTPPPRVDWSAADAKAAALVATMTTAEKERLLVGLNSAKPQGDAHLSAGFIPSVVNDASGLSVPAQYLCDGPSGVANGNTDVTRFPTGIAVAASWDVDLATAFGETVGAEWSGKGCTHGLGPGMNIIRLPYAGRSAEYYSEDPYLAARIAASEVKGIQSQHVIATVKHYAVNNQETARSGGDSVVSERALREIYLPAFEAALTEGGAGAVMCSYNRVNGSYACQDPYLLKDVLRRDWGFGGTVMTDWGAAHSTAESVKAGLDQVLPSGYYTVALLDAALAAGTITPGDLDTMARHVLAAMVQAGTFDAFPVSAQAAFVSTSVSTDTHKDLAQRISEEGSVLLKNRDGALPLDGSDAALQIAVIGGAADAFPQSTIGGSGSVKSSEEGGGVITPRAGISARAAGTVTYYQGSLGTGKLATLSADPTTGNATVYTTNPAGVDPSTLTPGFNLAFSDSEGNPIAGVGGVTPTISHGSGGMFAIYSFATPWPTTPVTLDGVTATLNSGTLLGWRAEFSGYQVVAAAGTYAFNLTGNARATLFVDGAAVGGIDTVLLEQQQSSTFPVTLTAGAHLVTVKYDTASWLWITKPCVSLQWNPAGNDLDAAVAGAAAADVAIVVVSDNESEGSDHPAYLPGDQDLLVARVAAAAKKTIVVMNTGSGLVLPWADKVDAILENWYGGQRLGAAIAALVFGDVNPSGKSVVTFPASTGQWYAQSQTQFPGTKLPGNSYPTIRYDEGILVGYRWFDATSQAPLFPFGHGLSYTTFGYSGLKLSAGSGDGSGLTVSVTVENTGGRQGAEVAQLYLSFPAWAGEPPRQLKAFKKVVLDPGASAKVTFQLDARAFSYWDEGTSAWVTPAGPFTIQVGSSSRDLRAAATYEVKGT